jgi:hypothetical protein
MKSKYTYRVEWDGPRGLSYKQEFDTITEARIALAMHNPRNSRMLVIVKKD